MIIEVASRDARTSTTLRGYRMDKKKAGLAIAIAAIVSVAIFFIVNYVAPGSPSWVAFFIVPITVLAVGMFRRNGE